MKKNNVTIADVAALAGVSKMTVSKVLRDTGSISKDTRDKIHKAVDELGYVKNSLAGLLSSQKSSMIGIIIPSASDTIFAEVLSGTNSVIRPKGFNTLIGESLFDPQIEYEALSTMLSLQPAGLIISGGIDRSEETLALIAKRRCPLISLWDGEDAVGDLTIGLSHYEAGETMARHFIECDFRKVAYVGSELDLDLCARQRFQGFRDTMQDASRELRVETSIDGSRQSLTGRQLTESLIRKHPDTDAIYYLNDAMATGGMSWLYEAGINIPEQVAAAGFNGTSIGQAVRTRLTTLNVSRRAIGEAAASAILKFIEGDTEIDKHQVEVTFVQGNTT
ncbi:MAG: LacI family DNA-binding transcriptional regulator [Stappiaceae bacterium]